MLKSLLGTFTGTQNAPTELRISIKYNLAGRDSHNFFCDFFPAKAQFEDFK